MKKKKEKVIKGIIALLFSQILIKIIGLAYKFYLTNKDGFGDTGNAIYSAGFQVYALLLTFSSTGVPNAIAKLVAERIAEGDNKGANKIFKIAFFTFAFFGLIGTIILFLGAKIIANKFLEIPEAEYSLITLSPSIFFVSITSVIRGYFNGRQNLTVTAKSQTIEQIFKTVFTILLVELIARITKKNTMLMAGIANLATTFATMLSFSYIYIYYKSKRKEIGVEIAQSVNYFPTRVRKTLKKIMKESIPISLSALMSSFNKSIDLITVVKILKRYMSEEIAKCQYGILSGKIDTLCVLPLSLNIPFVTAMVPSIAKSMAVDDKEQVIKKVNSFIEISSIIAFPCMVGIIVYSKQILDLLFPNANSGDVLLQINSISILFAMLSQTINGVLQGIGKSNIPLIAYTVGLVCKFITNIILISKPSIGINGAAIGNIICNLVVFIIVGYYLLKKLKLKLELKRIFFIPMLAMIFMLICSIVLKKILKNFSTCRILIAFEMLTSTMVYGATIATLRIIKKLNEKIFSKKRGILSKIGE